ncbi:SURF1 family protein [Natronospira sp.]|uniref:SURF1 family protein n=1 Tax=Natronospira sp. TaxID=2024970 RepID=UPI0038732F57
MRQQTGWQFKPPWWAWVLLLAGVLIFSSLSAWQLGRAEEKRELLELFEAGAETRVVESAEHWQELERYAPVRLKGRFLPEREFLLESMLREGAPGFHVWTPFRLKADGSLIVVDRGWIADEDVEARLAEQRPSTESLTVAGRVDSLPRPGFRLSAPSPEGDWPRRIYFPEAEDLQSQLGEPVIDGRLLMDAEASPGFRRDWDPINMPPERHLGYAFQWAAVTLAVIILFIVVNLKRVHRNE